MIVLVTGGAGFIGSAVARHLIQNTQHHVVVVDKLTYAGNLESLAPISREARFKFEKADICDAPKVRELLQKYQPDAILHLAAESHVDRSILGPSAFIETNITGTYTLLEAALNYWKGLSENRRLGFRFHHVSTDEVFGSLGPSGLFTETTPYQPNSPYSASKAASDHLVRAWTHTYGLPCVTTNCSNNFGPYQFPEKLIPLALIKALKGEPIPVYGKGENIRDWLFVEDHVEALLLVLEKGKIGETYNIGGKSEKTNLETVRTLCQCLDELSEKGTKKHADLISFVTDRPGHDFRYAIDCSKIEKELGWRPKHTFEEAMKKTVAWYLSNRGWWQHILDGTYQGERLGLLRENA